MVGRGGERRGAHSGEGEQLGVAGDALRPQIDRRGPSDPEVEDGALAAMQGFRRAVDRWGGRGGRGGAPGRIGEARGGRWPWVRRR